MLCEVFSKNQEGGGSRREREVGSVYIYEWLKILGDFLSNAFC